MNNLIIDQGNSKTKFFVINSQYKIIHKKKINNTEKKRYSILYELMELNVSYAIYSSVSGLDKQIIKIIQDLDFHIIFNHTTPIPIQNLYETKHSLGTDRLAGAIGANYLFPQTNLLVIDIGTAITYDFVDEKNRFLGGNISPGPLLRFRALHDYTKKLPFVNISMPQNFIAKNTKDAILNGVIWGIKAEIEDFIAQAKKKYPQIKPILTGGYAYFFGKIFKNYIFVNNYLVPLGLNHVLEFNKKINL